MAMQILNNLIGVVIVSTTFQSTFPPSHTPSGCPCSASPFLQTAWEISDMVLKFPMALGSCVAARLARTRSAASLQ